MPEIPVFRIHSERMQKDKFVAIAEHLGLRGEPMATEEALFLQTKQSALAYALPGSRFAGLLFFGDQSQGIAEPVERALSANNAEAWTNEFLRRFHLGARESEDSQVRVSFTMRAIRTDAATEQGEGGKEVRRSPVKTDVMADLRVNDRPVTGPRAKLRLTFKNPQAPVWMHRGLWERLEVFETRRMLTENEVYRRVSDRISPRGSARKSWSMLHVRLAYFAGEFNGGPDLLLPFYFAEVEFRDPKDGARTRQGPRQLLQIPACL
jgi:hypothetical protein